jgi:hypothetical protein
VGDDTINYVTTPNFTWVGQTWNSIGIVSNGDIIIGPDHTYDAYYVTTIFDAPLGGPNMKMLAPFWSDLNTKTLHDPGYNGAICEATLTDGSNSWIVVDWAGFPTAEQPDWGRPSIENFEVWIRINGGTLGNAEQVTFSYGDINTHYLFQLFVGAYADNYSKEYPFWALGLASNTELSVSTNGFPLVTPLPAALPLFATGLGALGLLGWRRKRKNAAALAA